MLQRSARLISVLLPTKTRFWLSFRIWLNLGHAIQARSPRRDARAPSPLSGRLMTKFQHQNTKFSKTSNLFSQGVRGLAANLGLKKSRSRALAGETSPRGFERLAPAGSNRQSPKSVSKSKIFLIVFGLGRFPSRARNGVSAGSIEQIFSPLDQKSKYPIYFRRVSGVSLQIWA